MKKMMLMLAAGIMSAALVACGQEAESAVTVGSEAIQESQAEETKSTEEDQRNKFVVGNVDNFSVNSTIVARFGKEVKSIVAEQDLEALADLVAFPVYMGFADGGVSVESREDFIALGADAVFTQEMVDAMAKADENSLSASKAGFSLTETGRPNVVFGVVGGKLAIQGMNY